MVIKKLRGKRVVTSYSHGHRIEYVKRKGWFYCDTGKPAFDSRKCKRCGKKPVIIRVKNGEGKWKLAKIDACIAYIVRAFQDANINMVSSCCGHGIMDGWIQLDGGRLLTIKKKEK